jgi:peptide/nickel transport system substrate-binding protein
MRRSMRRWFGLLVVLMTMAGLMLPTGSARAVEDPPRDQTVIMAFSSDITTLDPHDHILRLGIITMYHLFDNLVVRDLDTGKIIPHLATSWKIIDDTTWEFKLRHDVVFHNGEKFTAHTVKFNYDRVLDPANKLPQRGNHKEIKSVEVVDDYTVRFKTHRPYPIMLERMQNFQMLPEKYFKEKGKAYIAEHPVGTGPYKFVHWIRGRELLFERNDDYWGPKPAFKYAKIRIIPDTSTQIAELLSGGVDIVRALPPDQIEVVDASGVARHMVAPILRTAFLQLDSVGRSGKHPVQNVLVRKAMNHAVNIDGYIKYILNGRADRVATVINPKAFGYDPSVPFYEYNPEKAKQLLKQAGYPNGFELRFRTGLTTVEPGLAQTSQAIAADLEKVGIKVKFDQINEIGPYVTQVKEGKAGPMFVWSWGYYSVFDADGILYDLFHCGGLDDNHQPKSTPWAYYCNEQVDQWIEEARGTLDADRRKELYSKIQWKLHDDAAHLFKWGLHGIWGVSNRINWKAPIDEIDRMFLATPAQ